MFVLLRKRGKLLGTPCCLDRFLKKPFKHHQPPQGLREKVEVGSPPYAITQENFHVSLLTSTPANRKLWQSIAANNRRLSERRSHVKTTGLR